MLQNPQMSLLRGGSELLLRDTELALRSCSNWLRNKCVCRMTHITMMVHFVLNRVMQLLHCVEAKVPCKFVNILSKN